jgi:hypothetical protein
MVCKRNFLTESLRRWRVFPPIILILTFLFTAYEKTEPIKAALSETPEYSAKFTSSGEGFPSDVYREAVVLEDTDDRRISLVKKLTGISGDIEIEKSGWVDLDGDGDYQEYFAMYSGIGDDYLNCHHLAIVKAGKWEDLIYHTVTTFGFGYSIDFFQRNGKTQAMYYHVGGSAAHFSFSIFEYDPRSMFNEFNKIYEDGIGAYGNYYFLNQKLLFSGNGGKYNLSFVDGAYQLDDYDGREGITAPNELHFLYEHENDDFKIFFNNKEIRFRSEDGHMVNIDPIHIPKDTSILLNDYLKPDRFDIAIHYSFNTEVIGGFYDVFKFTEEGFAEVLIRADDWYNIEFFVE